MQQLGDRNRNSQVLLRKTDAPGTDHNARIWVLRCTLCGAIYGCNSTDGLQRKCPSCQEGMRGNPVPEGVDWSREEHMVAFNLYSKIPFGRIHMRNPEVIRLADLIGRSRGSISYKLANFARLDPALQARGIRGAERGARGEEDIWREFSATPEEVIFEGEQLRARLEGREIEETLTPDAAEEFIPPGLNREALVRVRLNQKFFRSRVLSAYDFRCCVTGLSHPELLVASHIVPWAQDAGLRLNPKNGLCLNALHDRAFDRGLMFVSEDFRIHFAPGFRKEAKQAGENADWLLGFEMRPLILPPRFKPDVTLLALHRERWRRVR